MDKKARVILLAGELQESWRRIPGEDGGEEEESRDN